VCGDKNENHDFLKLGGLNPLKFFQCDVQKVWEQNELILVWLVHSQVWWFWLDFVTLWCVGWKTKIMVWKSGWTQTSQMPPRWCGKSLGAKGIDHGMVGTKPSLVIWLDFVTWWWMGWKKKIMIFENWVDSILLNACKVMLKMFGSKWYWYCYGWCIAKFGDFC